MSLFQSDELYGVAMRYNLPEKWTLPSH